jgi:hypothetical protein
VNVVNDLLGFALASVYVEKVMDDAAVDEVILARILVNLIHL